MEFGILGPLSVRSDEGDVVELARPKVRLLLAVLLLHANSVVTAETLIDCLWGTQPVRSARANLKTYVVALRRALSPEDPARSPVRTARTGYSVRVPAGSVDVMVFAQLVEEARRARQRGDRDGVIERLEAALALWRGDAFEDVVPMPAALVAAAHQLDEQRLAVFEDLMTARVSAGHHASVIGHLQAWVARHPLRERMWEQLMLALYRDGRQAEALAVYKRLRGLLVEEVGVEPGRSLQELHGRILNADPTLAQVYETVARGAPTPHQLPRDVSAFIGREAVLGEVVELLTGTRPRRRTPVVVVHGAPGAGKSTFAVRVASTVSHRFPDGELYVNLHGSTPDVAPVSALETLGRFLRALGVDSVDVPHETEEAAALFRTLVANRRMLIVLDNAASAAQVRPLLPGGSGTGVVITSRDGLTTLDGAVHVPLRSLGVDAAEEMLRHLLPPESVVDRESTRLLAELCDRLPLGLHIAAARLKGRPDWTVTDFVTRLSDARDRLSELHAGDVAVRSSLGLSFSTLRHSKNPLDRWAARALCQLSLLEIGAVDVGAACALMDMSIAKAERVLERLVEAHLAEVDAGGRVRSHDLVRLFARERAGDTMRPSVIAATATRGIAYYVATARHAATLAYPRRTHGPMPEFTSQSRTFANQHEAQRWLETERANLVAVARQALRGDGEQSTLGLGLTIAVHWFFVHSGHTLEALELNEAAIRVAERIGDRASEAFVRDGLGFALSMRGRMAEAREQYQAELRLCRVLGDAFGEQRALGNLGRSYLTGGLAERAVPFLEAQRGIAREIACEVGEVFANLSLARAHHLLGHPSDAIGLLDTAVDWCDAAGDDYLGAQASLDLARALIDAGQPRQAVKVLDGSLERARRSRAEITEVWALVLLAQGWRLVGAPHRALIYASEAVRLVDPPLSFRAAIAARQEYDRALAAARASSDLKMADVSGLGEPSDDP